jgi:hypothetical protein
MGSQIECKQMKCTEKNPYSTFFSQIKQYASPTEWARLLKQLVGKE